MTEAEQNALLSKVSDWFKNTVIENHIRNIKKLKNPKEFNINPFLVSYIAYCMNGNASAENIARGLILPRALGTSINTSFGQNMQAFISSVLGAYGSTTSGIDIEFIADGHKKYAQVKLGPNTINKDDITTIVQHFNGIKNLSRTNNLRIAQDDLIVCVLYGDESELSNHYLELKNKHHIPIFTGNQFWTALTGSNTFYDRIIETLAQASSDTRVKKAIDDTVTALSQTPVIKSIAKT